MNAKPLFTLDPKAKTARLAKAPATAAGICDPKTIGITLSREQATQLAKVLLDASQEWNEIDLQGYRVSNRKLSKSKSYHLTINVHLS